MKSEKNAEKLDFIEVDPPSPALATFIWMHGLGASCEDFLSLAPELWELTGLALRFVLPQAPSRPVTINNGYVMPAWFDITSFDRNGKIDEQGISDSIKHIDALIAQEKEKGFADSQIFVAGFSQGAVIALNTLLTYPDKLAGAIALSGYLPPRHWPSPHRSPIFIGHGLADEIVPCAYGQAAYETLKTAGYPTTWHTYPMPHSVCDQEVRDLAQWIKGNIN